MADRVCVKCKREGSRGYVEGPEGWECSAASACRERVERERRNTGLYRWEQGDNHYYKLDGQRIPGVTTLIKDGLPSPGLIQWGIKSVARYAAEHVDELWAMRGMGEEAIFNALRQKPYQDRNDAGVRGKILHGYAERLHRGEALDLPPEHEHLLPWVQSLVEYLDDYEPTSVLQETAVAYRGRITYGGTLDDVSDFPDERRRVVDYKSGNNVYADNGLQLAAYRHAKIYHHAESGEDRPLEELGLSDEGYIVHVRPEGYKVVPFYIGPEVHQAFLRVAWVAQELRGDYRKGTGLLNEWMGQPLPRPERSRTA